MSRTIQINEVENRNIDQNGVDSDVNPKPLMAAALIRLITKQEHNIFNIKILDKDVSIFYT